MTMLARIAALVFLLIAPFAVAAPVSAAPTCQDRVGNTVRCGTASAMPVGWTAPVWDRNFVPADKHEELKAVVFLLLLFALIALLPDFEQEQWDEKDAEEKRRSLQNPKDDRRI
jgi:hypothetical protein